MSLFGLMQDRPLMVTSLLQYAATYHGDREIVGVEPDGSRYRSNYVSLDVRARQMASALQQWGVKPGDRVATLAWNTRRHFELFWAVSGLGAVLHTVNPRLFREQIRYIVRHASDRILFVEPDLLPLAGELADLGCIEQVVVMDSATSAATPLKPTDYESFIAQGDKSFSWPMFDERTASALCYTSGTTGNPKGVLYSHRSTVLHALAASHRAAFDIASQDTVLPMANMYHATAWAWPYIVALTGAKFVMAGRSAEPAHVQDLIVSEGVTLSGGVPTIWTMLLQHLETSGGGLGKLQRIIMGGSAVPRSMIEAFQQRHGVRVQQIWGMTETSPLGVVASPTARVEGLTEPARQEVLAKQGRAQYGVELRIVAPDGSIVPMGSEQSGDLWVRGPWVASGYFGLDQPPDFDDQSWFKTGDVATVDQHGYLTIVDRSKDVIKSGGEWISSIALENVVLSHPGVRQAAVVGVHHPKWEERPLLIVVSARDSLTKEDILGHLAGKVAPWWIPDDVVFVDKLPLTATGKISKRELRETYKNHLNAAAARPAA